jgi:hypothetical protein
MSTTGRIIGAYLPAVYLYTNVQAGLTVVISQLMRSIRYLDQVNAKHVAAIAVTEQSCASFADREWGTACTIEGIFGASWRCRYLQQFACELTTPERSEGPSTPPVFTITKSLQWPFRQLQMPHVAGFQLPRASPRVEAQQFPCGRTGEG